MAYTKRDDVPLAEGWLAVELDTEDLVAVRCDRKRVDAGVNYHAIAEHIDAAGVAQVDPTGRPIRTELKNTVTIARVEELSDAIVTRECLFAVLGEPVTEFTWPDTVLTGVNIRISIAAAQVSGAADAGSVL